MSKRVSSDLVIVANRLPVHRAGSASKWETSPGGLVSALLPVLQRDQGGWVGWAGSGAKVTDPFEHDGFMNVPVQLSSQEVDAYYSGFSNSTLWPLYHDACQTPRYHRRWWYPYVAINSRFAKAASAAAADGALVLVQDYHLQLVPGMLRELRPDLRIGFFLHIPFPPVELFAQLPWRSSILEGLLGADVVGFQTKQGAQNFIRLVGRYTDHHTKGLSVSVDSRRVEARAFPISIDVARYEKLANDPKVIARSEEVRRDLGNRKIVLGVDRLDYTKGIDIRLRAFRELLSSRRRSAEDTVFVQICVPSRESVDEYVELRSRVEELVGQINGEFSDVGRVAVHYLRRSFPAEELVAYYLAADVLVVTPFRDGMNLVAKEYVACRKDTGVLVLSEFTGASHELDRAILVNPHDIDDLSGALAQATNMPPPEQAKRIKAMRRKLHRHTVYDWADDLIGAVGKTAKQKVRSGSKSGGAKRGSGDAEPKPVRPVGAQA
jgi:trehalose 6-phosphate synthase